MAQENIKELKGQLSKLLQQEALKRGDFTLSSGKKSNYYLDGRVITLTPEGAYLAASIILTMMQSMDVEAVGGPTLGADPIIGSIACLAHQQKIPLKTFIVRKAAKGHGTQKQIEGPSLRPGSKVIIVDDVATTGKALLEAREALEKEGVVVKGAIVIVDRLEGAKENLSKAGIPLEAIFTIKEFGL